MGGIDRNRGRRRPPQRVPICAVACACALAASHGRALAQDNGTGAESASAHDYTVSLRLGGWAVLIEGEVADQGPLGNARHIRLDDDLGFDDVYPTFLGDLNFRMGRHDFSVIGTWVNEVESEPVRFSFEFGDTGFEIGRTVRTRAQWTDVNFRYGYSFFTLARNGFRLGPTFAVSYSDLEVDLVDVETGERETIEETFPVPTLGFYGEVPVRGVLVSGSFAAFYFNADSFEGSGMRARLIGTWRPFDHFGFFAGMNMTYADITLKKEDLNDIVLWGPTAGIELRY